MSFKKSVVLLLSVVALVSFADQRKAAIETAANLGYVDFSEITPEGAEIALELAQDYIQKNELDLIPGEPEPLYGYGYGDQRVAYMVFCHSTGAVRNIEDFKEILLTDSKIGSEFVEYYAIAEETEKPLMTIVPDELLERRSENSILRGDTYLIIVVNIAGNYQIVQASGVSGWICGLTLLEIETKETTGDDYGLVWWKTNSVYNPFSIFPITLDENDIPLFKGSHLYKPQYHNDLYLIEFR